jgi:hypothetical protein
MRIPSLLVAGVALIGLAACDSDVDPVQTQLQDAAIVRYINAVPDTSALDVRFIDGDIEGSPQWVGIGFRSFTGYQRVRSGTRRIRIFTNPVPYGNDASVATQTHLDTTLTFETNARYTVVSYGFARTGAAIRHRLVVIRDTLPSLTATQIGVRTIHAAAGVGNVDVYVQPSEGATAISGSPTVANVAPLASSGYLTSLAPRTAPNLYRWALTAAGSTTALPVTPNTGLAGVAGTTTANPLAGFQVARSAITVIVVPPSVVGSRAPQGGDFANAGVRFLPDRNLDTTEQ